MIDHAGAPSSLDIDQLWLDPASVFASPEDLVASDRLSTNQKIDALRRWEYDAVEIEVAEEEGMPSHDEHDLLRRILLVLGQLATVAQSESVPLSSMVCRALQPKSLTITHAEQPTELLPSRGTQFAKCALHGVYIFGFAAGQVLNPNNE